MTKAAARRRRRMLAQGLTPPHPDDPLPPITLMRRGSEVVVERTRGNRRLDLLRYRGGEVVGVTAMAHAQGYRLP